MTTPRDGAWYDRMYNNRALVPEFAMHFARWHEASEDTRAAHRCFQDVAYGKGPLAIRHILETAVRSACVL